MSSYTTERRTPWQQIGSAYTITQSRPRQRQRSSTGRTSWSLKRAAGSLLEWVWMLCYFLASLVGMVGMMVLAVLAMPVIILGPFFVIALAVGAVTQLFRAFGLA